MPLALEPDEVFEIVLDSDARGDGPHPTFRFRHPTVRIWLRVAELADSWDAERESGKRTRQYLESLGLEKQASDKEALEFRKGLTDVQVAEITKLPKGSGKETKDLMQEVLDIVADRLVGWSNLKDEAGKPIPFDPGKLPDVVTVGEIFELMYKFRSGAALEADARKNSERPSSSGSESSAPDDAEGATAPPKPNRP